jgi:hypothetical protein
MTYPDWLTLAGGRAPFRLRRNLIGFLDAFKAAGKAAERPLPLIDAP